MVIGYAIVPVENEDAYTFFFEMLNELDIDADDGNFGEYLQNRNTVIISDRDKGLHNAVESCYGDVDGRQGAIHLPCCFHLLANLLKRESLFPPETFWWLQKSSSQ